MEKLALTPIGKIIVHDDETVIKLDQKYIPALTGLEGFGHLQVIWWFDGCDNSVARVRRTYIDIQNGIIGLGYIDANNGSPVLDLKPYTPSLDRVEMPRVPVWCAHWPACAEQSGEFDWEGEFNF